MTRQRSELDAFNSQLDRSVRAAREANGSQQAGDFDDLVTARSGVWLVAAWIAIVTALVMLLGGCGGGIDDSAELLYGPPAELASTHVPAALTSPSGQLPRTTPVGDAPKPCPVDPAACQPASTS